MLGSLRVKQESSYQQTIDPPGSDSKATTGKRQNLEGQISLSETASASWGEASDIKRSDKERGGKTSCDIFSTSSGETRVYSYKIASSEAWCSVDRCPAYYSVRQKDSHWLLSARAWQTNSSCPVRGEGEAAGIYLSRLSGFLAERMQLELCHFFEEKNDQAWKAWRTHAAHSANLSLNLFCFHHLIFKWMQQKWCRHVAQINRNKALSLPFHKITSLVTFWESEVALFILYYCLNITFTAAAETFQTQWVEIGRKI